MSNLKATFSVTRRINHYFMWRSLAIITMTALSWWSCRRAEAPSPRLEKKDEETKSRCAAGNFPEDGVECLREYESLITAVVRESALSEDSLALSEAAENRLREQLRRIELGNPVQLRGYVLKDRVVSDGEDAIMDFILAHPSLIYFPKDSIDALIELESQNKTGYEGRYKTLVASGILAAVQLTYKPESYGGERSAWERGMRFYDDAGTWMRHDPVSLYYRSVEPARRTLQRLTVAPDNPEEKRNRFCDYQSASALLLASTAPSAVRPPIFNQGRRGEVEKICGGDVYSRANIKSLNEESTHKALKGTGQVNLRVIVNHFRDYVRLITTSKTPEEARQQLLLIESADLASMLNLIAQSRKSLVLLYQANEAMSGNAERAQFLYELDQPFLDFGRWLLDDTNFSSPPRGNEAYVAQIRIMYLGDCMKFFLYTNQHDNLLAVNSKMDQIRRLTGGGGRLSDPAKLYYYRGMGHFGKRDWISTRNSFRECLKRLPQDRKIDQMDTRSSHKGDFEQKILHRDFDGIELLSYYLITVADWYLLQTAPSDQEQALLAEMQEMKEKFIRRYHELKKPNDPGFFNGTTALEDLNKLKMKKPLPSDPFPFRPGFSEKFPIVLDVPTIQPWAAWKSSP